MMFLASTDCKHHTDANSLDYTHGEEIALKDPNVDGNPVIAIQRIDNVEKLSDDDIDNIVKCIRYD